MEVLWFEQLLVIAFWNIPKDVWWAWCLLTVRGKPRMSVLFAFPGLQTGMAQCHCMSRPIVQLENESFSQTISSQRGWHATEEWSGTPFLSVCSSSCLQFLKRQSICAPEYFYHVSLWASCFVILTFHLVPGWPDLLLDEKLFSCKNNCNVGYTPNAKHFISTAF